MKKLVPILLSLALLAGCSALPRGREMEELELLLAAAVDPSPEGVEVTAVSGVRASDAAKPKTYSAQGENLTAACQNVREKGGAWLYFGQLERLLLGEDQVKTDLMGPLNYVLSDPESRLDTLLYIVEGDAGAGLSASARDGEPVRTREEDAVTVGQVLSALEEDGAALVPALSPGEGGALEKAGYAIVTPAGPAGRLTGDAAWGAELLRGRGLDRVVGDLRVEGVQVTAEPAGTGVSVTCAVTANVAQGRWPADGGAGLAEEVERCVALALAPGVDCFGLRRRAALGEPWRWDELQEISPENMDVTVSVRPVRTEDQR